MAAWRSLLRFHALASRALDADLRSSHGIPIDWYDVMVQLNEHGGRMRMGALAEVTLFGRANCTRIVDRMQGRGLVEREVDPDDHRGRVAVLTRAGRSLLAEAARTHLAGIERHFAGLLDDDEAAVLAGALARLADSTLLADEPSTEAGR